MTARRVDLRCSGCGSLRPTLWRCSRVSRGTRRHTSRWRRRAKSWPSLAEPRQRTADPHRAAVDTVAQHHSVESGHREHGYCRPHAQNMPTSLRTSTSLSLRPNLKPCCVGQVRGVFEPMRVRLKVKPGIVIVFYFAVVSYVRYGTDAILRDADIRVGSAGAA